MKAFNEIKLPLGIGACVIALALLNSYKESWGMYAFCGSGILLGVFLLAMMVKQWADTDAQDIREQFQRQEQIGRAIECRYGDHGAVYGFKRLILGDELEFLSPAANEARKMGYPVDPVWKNMQLTADAVPELDNSNGIWVHASQYDPDLDYFKNGSSILVEVELRSQKVIHERGARGYFGRIVNIVDIEPGLRFSDGSSVRDYYIQNGWI